MSKPQIIEELDYEALLAASKAHFIRQYPDSERAHWAALLELESEPIVKLLQTVSYLELLLRARINAAARANLLAFATASDLDLLAEFYGLQRLAAEDDARFRERIRARIAGFSTAGSREHYRHHALSAHLDVQDVYISSPRAGLVRIAILSRSSAGLEAARQRLQSDAVKVLTDTVEVQAARFQSVPIRARLRLRQSSPQLEEQLKGRLEALFAHKTLGEPVARSALMVALHHPDVVAVDLMEPAADLDVKPDAVAQLGEVQLEITAFAAP